MAKANVEITANDAVKGCLIAHQDFSSLYECSINEGSNCVNVSNRITIESENRVIIKGNNGDELVDFDNPHLPFMLLKSMPFQRAKLCVESMYLTFMCPNTWSDPFEYLFYDEKKLEGKLYCLCASYSRAENEEAMWQCYGDKAESNNILCLNMTKLFDALRTATVLNSKSKTGIQFFAVPIDYSLSKKELLAQRKYFSKATNNPLAQTIDYMAYKRKAFKYEDELRIFAYVTDRDVIADNPNFLRLRVPLLEGVLGKVILPPYPPRRRGDLTDVEYENLQAAANSGMRNYWENVKKGTKLRIEQSRLYQTK